MMPVVTTIYPCNVSCSMTISFCLLTLFTQFIPQCRAFFSYCTIYYYIILLLIAGLSPLECELHVGQNILRRDLFSGQVPDGVGDLMDKQLSELTKGRSSQESGQVAWAEICLKCPWPLR